MPWTTEFIGDGPLRRSQNVQEEPTNPLNSLLYAIMFTEMLVGDEDVEPNKVLDVLRQMFPHEDFNPMHDTDGPNISKEFEFVFLISWFICLYWHVDSLKRREKFCTEFKALYDVCRQKIMSQNQMMRNMTGRDTDPICSAVMSQYTKLKGRPVGGARAPHPANNPGYLEYYILNAPDDEKEGLEKLVEIIGKQAEPQNNMGLGGYGGMYSGYNGGMFGFSPRRVQIRKSLRNRQKPRQRSRSRKRNSSRNRRVKTSRSRRRSSKRRGRSRIILSKRSARSRRRVSKRRGRSRPPTMMQRASSALGMDGEIRYKNRNALWDNMAVGEEDIKKLFKTVIVSNTPTGEYPGFWSWMEAHQYMSKGPWKNLIQSIGKAFLPCGEEAINKENAVAIPESGFFLIEGGVNALAKLVSSAQIAQISRVGNYTPVMHSYGNPRVILDLAGELTRAARVKLDKQVAQIQEGVTDTLPGILRRVCNYETHNRPPVNTAFVCGDNALSGLGSLIKDKSRTYCILASKCSFDEGEMEITLGSSGADEPESSGWVVAFIVGATRQRSRNYNSGALNAQIENYLLAKDPEYQEYGNSIQRFITDDSISGKKKDMGKIISENSFLKSNPVAEPIMAYAGAYLQCFRSH